VVIDIDDRSLSLEVDADELRGRLDAWTPPAPKYARGVFAKYAAAVSSASQGAVTS
jgi:dihydroxy-acid dehydratase